MILKKRHIANIAIFISAIVISFGCREQKNHVKLAGTLLEISDSIINNCTADTFRFGNIKHGETVMKDFAVNNAGKKPFIINKVDTDCGCMATDFEKKPIKPGESTKMSISFTSRGYYGYILKRIKVMTTACEKPMIFYIEADIQ